MTCAAMAVAPAVQAMKGRMATTFISYRSYFAESGDLGYQGKATNCHCKTNVAKQVAWHTVWATPCWPHRVGHNLTHDTPAKATTFRLQKSETDGTLHIRSEEA
jgi:hypothetical protein